MSETASSKVAIQLDRHPRDIFTMLDLGRMSTDSSTFRNMHISEIREYVFPAVLKDYAIKKFGSDCGIVGVSYSFDTDTLWAVFDHPQRAMLFKLSH